MDIEETLRRVLREELGRLAGEQLPGAVSMETAAERLEVSVTTIKRMVARGELLAVRVGKRSRISLEELRRVTTAQPSKVGGLRTGRSSSRGPRPSRLTPRQQADAVRQALRAL